MLMKLSGFTSRLPLLTTLAFTAFPSVFFRFAKENINGSGQMFRSMKRSFSNIEEENIKKMDSGDNTYKIVERGSLHSLDYRIFFKKGENYVSPWHDVPLFANEKNEIYNMIVEIPRWTNAKMEMATKDPLSPIKQDVKKGAPRFVNNIFPFHGYIWNYGALPQTWEDPNHVDNATQAKGDNDPIDAIEIGSKVLNRGDVVKVKILGTLALIDEGETDWKLVTLNVDDPLSSDINCLADVEKFLPGLLQATREWFRNYKIPTGKPANIFGLNEEYQDASFAKKIVKETHEFWKDLLKRESPELNTTTSISGNLHSVSQDECSRIVENHLPHGDPYSIPSSIENYFFITN